LHVAVPAFGEKACESCLGLRHSIGTRHPDDVETLPVRNARQLGLERQQIRRRMFWRKPASDSIGGGPRSSDRDMRKV
jgi:hypothetical protein